MKRVVVTGIGLISPLGCGVERVALTHAAVIGVVTTGGRDGAGVDGDGVLIVNVRSAYACHALEVEPELRAQIAIT